MPYQLLLHLRFKKNKNGPWQMSMCGGTLITLAYAISAYRCFNSAGKRIFINNHTVYAGTYLWDPFPSSEDVQVGEYYMLCRLCASLSGMVLWVSKVC